MVEIKSLDNTSYERDMNSSQNGLLRWISTNKSYIGYNHPVGVLMLSVLGLVVWILGYRLIKPIVIVAAFVFAGVGFYSLSPDVFSSEFCCDGNHNREVRISISIICGLLAGALACYVYKIGVFCMGCIVGWAVSIVVVTFWFSKDLTSDLAFYSIYGATGLVFGILAVWLEKVFIIFATSLIGSLMFLLGLDHYCRTAFTVVIEQILFKTKDALSQAANHPGHVTLEFHEAHETFTQKVLAMFLGWLLMSAVGAMLQFMYTAQEIDTKLFIKSCGCGCTSDGAEPGDKGVRYVVLPPPKLRALLLHQNDTTPLMKDSWDDITHVELDSRGLGTSQRWGR